MKSFGVEKLIEFFFWMCFVDVIGRSRQFD
jgi:hypothetical protein